jgi:ABC-type Fe3+-hydroxamate transport system substrate-binding protein
MTIRDVLGHDFDFTSPPRRVVSLVPSLTESLFDLGAGASVVGITDWCIFPPGLTLPRLGGTKNPRVAEIQALAPDLVYVNVEENLKRHADAIAAFAPVFSTEPKSLDDVALLIDTLGTIHDRRERAGELVAQLNDARFTASPFTFLVPIWKSPWMWCGGDTYVSALVESVGGRNLLRGRERYPTMDLDCALALEPDILFLPDEPYLFTPEDAAVIQPSSRARMVGPFPGHLFTWHGTRTILGLRFLRNDLDPFWKSSTSPE